MHHHKDETKWMDNLNCCYNDVRGSTLLYMPISISIFTVFREVSVAEVLWVKQIRDHEKTSAVFSHGAGDRESSPQTPGI